jgi:hypothetical protein
VYDDFAFYTNRVLSIGKTCYVGATEMYLLLLILSGLGSCFLVTLMFGLLRAGRRADEGEERILEQSIGIRTGQ